MYPLFCSLLHSLSLERCSPYYGCQWMCWVKNELLIFIEWLLCIGCFHCIISSDSYNNHTNSLLLPFYWLGDWGSQVRQPVGDPTASKWLSWAGAQPVWVQKLGFLVLSARLSIIHRVHNSHMAATNEHGSTPLLQGARLSFPDHIPAGAAFLLMAERSWQASSNGNFGWRLHQPGHHLLRPEPGLRFFLPCPPSFCPSFHRVRSILRSEACPSHSCFLPYALHRISSNKPLTPPVHLGFCALEVLT